MNNNKPLSVDLLKKLSTLKKSIQNRGKVCVAFSGGVDSTLLLKVAHEVLGTNVMAITVNGAMLPNSEFQESQKLAQDIGITPMVIEADVFSLDDFVANHTDRCYHCKKYIFSQIKSASEGQGFNILLDGSNLDDLKDYRPGIKALGELGVYSPLKESGLTKQNIRDLSKYYNLPTANKPAMACLATRIPTDTPITKEALTLIETGEEILKGLGLTQYRLRLLNTTVKIECDPKDFSIILKHRLTLIQNLENLGATTITLDLKGYVCGNMNA
ncbi:MAG: ATP-dependent sacrificial sulfur transferase LarE [Eubacteriaceae bacterium]